MDSAHLRRKAVLVALILLPVTALLSCADDRAPYDAYVACNEQIRSASNDEQMLACFTGDKRAEILARHANHTPDIWRNQFRDIRPHEPKLFREVMANGGDTAEIYMYGGSGVYLTRYTATMKRESGAWKIADENTLSVSPGFNDRLDAPAEATLSFTGAVRWEGADALTVQAPVRPECYLQVRHVYDFASVQMQVDCDKLETPGEYTVENIQHPQAKRPPYIQAPEGGRLDDIDDGLFTVESFSEGRFSATFDFDVAGLKGPYSVAGSVRNLPIIDARE